MLIVTRHRSSCLGAHSDNAHSDLSPLHVSALTQIMLISDLSPLHVSALTQIMIISDLSPLHVSALTQIMLISDSSPRHVSAQAQTMLIVTRHLFTEPRLSRL